MENEFNLTSHAFSDGESIPLKYTCNGDNINPPLLVANIPEGSQTLALIMDDPDVPSHVREDNMWDHWIVFNIPTREGISEFTINEGQEPDGTQGVTTSGNLHYGGPCPPDREHRYFFRVYALPTNLNLEEGATKTQVEGKAIEIALAKATLMGRYEQSK